MLCGGDSTAAGVVFGDENRGGVDGEEDGTVNCEIIKIIKIIGKTTAASTIGTMQPETTVELSAAAALGFEEPPLVFVLYED